MQTCQAQLQQAAFLQLMAAEVLRLPQKCQYLLEGACHEVRRNFYGGRVAQHIMNKQWKVGKV